MTSSTEVRERPILFSPRMVHAILEGQKTQTRRVITKRFTDREVGDHGICMPGENYNEHLIRVNFPCPFGAPGDRLWVRESFTRTTGGEVLYRAHPMYDGMKPGDFAWSWTPSIHMPRKLSRIMLEVIEVRVQELRDITDEDALAEGMKGFTMNGQPIEAGTGDAVAGFSALWDHLNAERGFSWDRNPWVWAISFRVLPLTQKPVLKEGAP